MSDDLNWPHTSRRAQVTPCAYIHVVAIVQTKKPPRFSHHYTAAKTTMNKLIDHIQSHVWFVHWHQMARTVHLHEMESLCAANSACNIALKIVVVISCLVEGILTTPLQFSCPSFVPTPITQIVHLTCIDQRLNAIIKQFGDQLVIIDQVISCTGEEQLHFPVARSPFLLNSKLFLNLGRVKIISHGIEIVAQRPLLASNTHIVRIPVGEFNWHLCHDVTGIKRSQASSDVDGQTCVWVMGPTVTISNACCAGRHRQCHQTNHFAVEDTRSMTALCCAAILTKLGVPLVLLFWVRQAIANANTSQRNLEIRILVVLPHSMGNCGNIMPRIRLTENVELVLLILWELFVKILQECPHVG